MKEIDSMEDDAMNGDEPKDESTIIADAQPQIEEMAKKGDIAQNAMPVDSGEMVLDLDQFDMLVEEESGDDVIFVGHGIVKSNDGNILTIDLRNASVIHGKDYMKADMNEFKKGTLHSGSKNGPVVKDRKQAVAIGLSESRKRAKK